MITFTQKGDFSSTTGFLQGLLGFFNVSRLDEYGRMGVAALSANTPIDTGLTAASWEYKIEKNSKGPCIYWYNTNVQNGENIAIILQYGYTTRTGKYVKGRDYINPAIQPVFDMIANDALEE